MAIERTLSIIKPDATRRNLTGAITDRLEKAGLRVVAARRLRLTQTQAEGFYAVHRQRPFFASLCAFMTSGPVVAQRRIRLARTQAEAFYAVHRERPFYRSLCEFMTSGPVVVQVLEGESAIEKNREVMGATDPAKAAPGTIRKDFAESIEANSVHGSDAPDTAAREISFFFAEVDIVG